MWDILLDTEDAAKSLAEKHRQVQKSSKVQWLKKGTKVALPIHQQESKVAKCSHQQSSAVISSSSISSSKMLRRCPSWSRRTSRDSNRRSYTRSDRRTSTRTATKRRGGNGRDAPNSVLILEKRKMKRKKKKKTKKEK